ncbi:PAS domain S-box protein [Rhizobium sp. MHM7A]|uniref:PAS domain-containing protein n=1 Tax=Rhizobium sp. MHM7A TaxID=2583233 RepID=UPI001FF0531D|nr:PAS domain S-box protein [Rhizobium sp. MHM7A]
MRFSFFQPEARSILNAIGATHPIIEFDLNGKVIDANPLFLRFVGYGFNEIKGEDHAIFVSSEEKQSPDYRQFWQKLREGHAQRKRFKRVTKAGREVWMDATYCPVGQDGKPHKIVVIATDVTQRTAASYEERATLTAISQSQAVIEFLPDGTVIRANANFCATMGYEASEIVGKHHNMFCKPEYVASPE